MQNRMAPHVRRLGPVNLTSLLRSPFVRVPFLLFAVVATVATSQPSWSLDSTPLDEGVKLVPGASFERKVEYEASHPVVIETELSGSSEVGAKLRITQDDASNGATPDAGRGVSGATGCDGETVFEPLESGKWKKEGYDGKPVDRVIEARSSCDSKKGTLTFRITNEGTASAQVHVKLQAVIRGDGDTDAPDGAFVRAKVIP
jgi:hypothetical protein